MKSIQRTVTSWLLLGIGSTAIAAGTGLYLMIERRLVASYDRTLAVKTRAVAGGIDYNEVGLELEFRAELMPDFQNEEDPEYFQATYGDGRPLARSETLDDEAELPVRYGAEDELEFFDVELPDGRSGRAAGLRLTVEHDFDEDDDDEEQRTEYQGLLDAIVVVARERESLDEALAAVRGGLFGVGGLMALLIVLIVLLSVRRGLRPLVRLGAAAEEIDAHTLSQRLPNDGQPAELKPLTATLNRVLARLEEGFSRERRLSASMAHELRTPIAELQNTVEVAQRWRQDPELIDDALETSHEVALRMGQLVDTLLRLGRLEVGTDHLRVETFELEGLIRETWTPLDGPARERGLDLDHSGSGTISTDRGLLGLVVSNLLRNAVAHARAGTRIESRIEDGKTRVSWALANEANGLQPDEFARMTEPFWRKDDARTDHSHVGLGLSIARAAARQLGAADLDIALEGGRITIGLTLPAARGGRRGRRGAAPVRSKTAQRG